MFCFRCYLLFDRDVIGLAEASVKAQLEFGGKRGAVLIMHDVQTWYIPGELVYKLECGNFDSIKSKALVTHVETCSSYARYLSTASTYHLVKFFS